MTKITPALSNKIANLSFICACLVVLLHIFPDTTELTFFWSIDKFVACGIGRMAVPFFCMVSGFFVAMHMGEEFWYRSALKKRMTTLVIPFVVWNIAWLVLMRQFGLYGMWKLLDPFHQPPLGPLWYIRSLIVFIILTPLLGRLVKSHIKSTLIISFLAYVFLFVPGNKYLAVFTCTLHLEALFYYILGLTIAERSIDISKKPTRLILVCGLVISVCVAVVRMAALKKGWYIYFPLRGFVIPGFLLAAWALIPSKKWNPTVTRSAFAIYLAHMFCFVIIRKFVGSCDSLAEYAIYATGGLCMPITISAFLHRFLPRLSALAFGGR